MVKAPPPPPPPPPPISFILSLHILVLFLVATTTPPPPPPHTFPSPLPQYPSTDSSVKALQTQLAAEFGFQIGFILLLPLLVYAVLEKGLGKGLETIFGILIRGSPLFYAFQTGGLW